MRRSRVGEPSQPQAEREWGSSPPSASGASPQALRSFEIAAVPATASPWDAPNTSAPAPPFDSLNATGPRQRPPSASRRRPESARGSTSGLAPGLGTAGLPRGDASSEAPRRRALLVNGLVPAASEEAAVGGAPRTGYKQLLRRHGSRFPVASARTEMVVAKAMLVNQCGALHGFQAAAPQLCHWPSFLASAVLAAG